MYGTALGDLWRRIVAVVNAQYGQIDPASLADSFRAFVPQAAEIIALGQQQAQALAAAFMAQYVETETGRAFRAAPVSNDITGTTRDGVNIRTALSGSVAAVWLSMASGLDVTQSLARGRRIVARTAGMTVSDAAEREQTHQAEQAPQVSLSGTLRSVPVDSAKPPSGKLLKGWTWVVVGHTCAACLAQQDGSIQPWDRKGRRHPGCDCVRSPVVIGAPDTVTRPTGAELFDAMTPEQQAAVFASAGEEKAKAIRSGQATLADFAHTAPTAAGQVITEAPLGEVA
ncbi:MAG TPA: hypothetical protein VFM74_04595 [Candidatus Limnocylindria bacterium]|nr:hypothetical protein [Candidatus Limnocylindria bacterium]